jgi:hypothetical protein
MRTTPIFHFTNILKFPPKGVGFYPNPNMYKLKIILLW